MAPTVAVHGGAGCFKGNVEQSCSMALKFTPSGPFENLECSRLVKAIMNLEKCPTFNCGIGSNLTEIETVECEAAFMCSQNLAFGAVAAVTNCAHPIYAASKLAEAYKLRLSQSALIPPMVLVGNGANRFCDSLGIGIMQNEQLRTKTAQKEVQLAKEILNENKQFDECVALNSRLDTVGAVLIDADGLYCEAGVSSGGILLKKEGRLGHSAQFGAAIWAEQRRQTSVAVSLSGCGESFVRTHLAETLADFAFSCEINDVFLPEKVKTFLEGQAYEKSNRISTFPKERLLIGGLMAIKSLSDETTTLYAFHNTKNFPLAFKGSAGKINRYKSKNDKVGEFVCNSFII